MKARLFAGTCLVVQRYAGIANGEIVGNDNADDRRHERHDQYCDFRRRLWDSLRRFRHPS